MKEVCQNGAMDNFAVYIQNFWICGVGFVNIRDVIVYVQICAN